MLVETLVLFVAAVAGHVPPVPGGCQAPAAENVGKPGCYLSADVVLSDPPATLYWHIFRFDDGGAARVQAQHHRWATVVHAHGATWLYVLDGRPELAVPAARSRAASLGPMRVDAGVPLTARFTESIFPPGMRTRNHIHHGPEAYFVVEGHQCVETPTQRHVIPPEAGFVVQGGPHLQASREGRKSIALNLAPTGKPWMALDHDWKPSGFCD